MTHVLITGANGKIAGKLKSHFTNIGWKQTLLSYYPEQPAAAESFDLSLYSDAWANKFSGVDAVIHLAANAFENASYESVEKNNNRTAENVIKAALIHKVPRMIFASSNWVMAGYRFSGEHSITTDLPPKPVNPYGFSKLFGEHLGRHASEQGMSFIAFRIGYCQAGDNLPGSHMALGTWGQRMWLSNRDLCQAMERAVLCDLSGFAILNLMSDNPGMRWDISGMETAIGYIPQDGAAAHVTPKVIVQDVAARLFHTVRSTMGRAEKRFGL